MNAIPCKKISDFEFISDLGSGFFGSVSLMKYKNTSVEYAVKKFDIKYCSTAPEELEKLISLDHPCIVKFDSLILNNDSTFSISMEYAPNGSVKEKLQGDGFTPTERSIIALGISCGLQELHSRNILHCDLKPGNVLLDKYNYPLICDFGLSVKQDDVKNIEEFYNGTFPYIPPEMIKKKKSSKKADIFAFGIILYNILTGKQMFRNRYEGVPEYEAKRRYNNNERPSLDKYEKKNSKICDLIKKCWDNNPDVRPNIDEIVQYLSRIENVFNKTEEKPFFDYIDFVNKKLGGKFDEIAKKALKIPKSQLSSDESRKLLETSLSASSKYKRKIIKRCFLSYFNEEKLSQKELENAKSFFLSNSRNFSGEDCLIIGDKFRDYDSEFALDFYELSAKKGCEEGRKRIQKFLTYENLNLSFDRFLYYSFQNADYINEQNMFSIDVEQEMNCLFIAKNYIDYKQQLQNKLLKEKNSIESNNDSVENDESKYDHWIEILSEANYQILRCNFYSQMNKESKYTIFSDEYYREIAELGCPSAACILADRKWQLIQENVLTTKEKELHEQFLYFVELSIINGSKNKVEIFKDELNRGEYIKKDASRADRLDFFLKKPYSNSDLFKFESFFEKNTKQIDSEKVETNNQLDDHDYSYNYSDEEVEEEKEVEKVKVFKKSSDSILKKEKNKKKDKKIKTSKSTPQMTTQKKGKKK